MDVQLLIGIVVVLAAISLTYVGVVGVLAIRQRKMIFRPDRARPDFAGLPGSSIQIQTPDGLSLQSWLVRPDRLLPVILYLHGNAGHIGYRTARLRDFNRIGWGILLLGYRGYGGNPGTPSEAGLLTDARAALRALEHRGLGPGRVVVWGESLGTGVAVALAAETAVAALILEAPFTSLTDVVARRFPWVPVRWLLRDHFDSAARIAAVRCPLFVLAGERDDIVPPDLSRALYAAANEPKSMLVLPRAGHHELGTPAAMAAAVAFMPR